MPLVCDKKEKQNRKEELLEILSSIPGSILSFPKERPRRENLNLSTIYTKGADPADLYIVLEGLVILYHYPNPERRLIYNFKGRGDVFGNIYDIPVYTEDASSSALSDTKIRRIAREVLVDYGFERILEEVKKEEHLHSLRMRDLNVPGLGITGTLVSALIDLAKRFKSQFGTETESVALPITQQEISEYLGSTARVTISRTISELRDLGIIEDSPRTIVAVNLPEAELFLQTLKRDL